MSLFTASLEKRNRRYLKDVKLQDLNNQYQKEINAVIRQSELQNLSPIDIANNLRIIRENIENEAAERVLKSKLKKQKEQEPQKEEYKPMTASEYENALQNRYKKIGVLLPDFPAVPPTVEDIRPQKVKEILNLYSDEPKKQVTGLMAEIIAVSLNKAQKRDLNKTELNNAIQKNLNAVVNNPDINKKLMTELEDAIRNINLKKTTPREIKVKELSPFQQELANKIAQKEATSSSQATTASTTSILDEIPEKEYNKHISKHSAIFRNEYEAKTGKKYPYKGNIKYETMRRERAQWGQGLLRKKKGKK